MFRKITRAVLQVRKKTSEYRASLLFTRSILDILATGVLNTDAMNHGFLNYLLTFLVVYEVSPRNFGELKFPVEPDLNSKILKEV